MWLKILGSAMVIAAGAGIGFTLAGRLGERPRQIRQLISSLTALGAYISYVSLPLSEALARAAAGVGGPVGEFFRRVAAVLAHRGWLSPREAVAEVLAELGPHLAWRRPEQEILLLLSANLGLSGRDEQQKYLALVIDQLAVIEQEALRHRDQNARMYRYLGVCGGLAAAILLV